MNKNKYIKLAKKSASTQINELKKINKVFNKSFIQAVDLILNCKGKIITAGIGKSGLIARKISATLSSVGTPSFFLSPDFNHGDLGQIEKKEALFKKELKHPQIKEIRGKGLMLAVIVKNEEMVDKIIEKCIKKGEDPVKKP